MRKILKLLFDLSAFLFPIVLVFYLILFLLENVFPGFVSNIFDLNYLLIPVVFFGFLAALSNPSTSLRASEAEASPPTRWDFFIVTGLSILSFVVLVYKTGDMGWTGFFISIISAILVGFVSLFLLFSKDEEEKEEVIEAPKKEFNISKLNREKHNYKKLLISPIGFSLTGLVIVIILGGLVFSLFQGKAAEEKKIVDIKKEAGRLIQLPKPAIPEDKLLKETSILIQNGSGITGKASSMAALLKEFNFGDVITGDANNSNYNNAYIMFNQKDLKVASYIMFLLIDNGEYNIVNMIPPINASQSGIILILGQ